MGKHEKVETSAQPGEDEVGPVSGEGDAPTGTTPGADPAEAEEIEAERAERLDPDNRPADAEVDNTHRTFDPEKGMFDDSEGYEQAEERFPPLGEQGA